MIVWIVASFCLVTLTAFGGTWVRAKVPDRFVPASYDQIRLDGVLGERMRMNLEGRLLHVDEVALIAGFEHRPGKQDWIGEHAGKFLDAAANTWLYTHDARLKTLMDRTARELIAAQLPDGYLGTYTDDKRWTSWDVWVHKYDLIGLLRYYEVTGYEPALACSRKIGYLLAKTFGTAPGQRDLMAASTHVGMAASSVLEPVVKLYRLTGDKRYLDFCLYVVGAWEQANGPKLISSLLKTGSVYKTANAKAYEMMSDLVGLLELYRVTGTPEYLSAAEAAWDDIHSKRMYLTGTTSSKEHFTPDFELPGEQASNVGEGCATVTWLQLTASLLRLTADPKYANQIERTIYNQLLAAQDPSNGNICYFTPLNGKKNPTPGINCCVSSEPRGISLIPQMAAGTIGKPALLLYAPGEWNSGGLLWKIETDYPLSGKIVLRVAQGNAETPILLRVPEWTSHYQAMIGRHIYRGTPGTFLELRRTWKPGDRVVVDMDMTVRETPGGPSYPNSVAIERGPQVLALEQAVNPNLPDLQGAGPREPRPVVKRMDAVPVGWLNYNVYTMEGMVAGAPGTLYLVPFADARSYRVWLLKPPGATN